MMFRMEYGKARAYVGDRGTLDNQRGIGDLVRRWRRSREDRAGQETEREKGELHDG